MTKTKMLSMAAILSLATMIPNAYALKNGQTFKKWKAVCEKQGGKEVCGVTQTVFGKDKANKKVPLAIVDIFKLPGKKDPLVNIKVPVGLFLPAGVAVAVDKKGIAKVPYTTCVPLFCSTDIILVDEVAKKMKKGRKLQIGVINRLNKEEIYEFSLSGVTSALKAL